MHSAAPHSGINKTRAFTLVELLAVIAIIGVLVGILIPVAFHMRSKARAGQCVSNMRQIAISLILYANDNRGVTVSTHYPDDDLNWAQKVTRWDNSIRTLVEGKSFGAWRCPENDDQTKVPMANGTDPRNTSYMLNGWRNDSEATDYRYAKISVAGIQNPAKLYMVLEGRYFRCETASQSGSSTIPADIYVSARSLNYARYPHDGGMNIAFADGHVARQQGPVLDRGSSGGTQMRGYANGDAWYAY